MEAQDLTNLMNAWSGGSDGRTRHWANKRFIYTEGVQDVAEKAGAHWLLDILATEVAPICLGRWDLDREHMHFVEIKVADSQAVLSLVRDTGETPLWQREIAFTTFPDGDWMLYLAMDGLIELGKDVLVCLLPQEY